MSLRFSVVMTSYNYRQFIAEAVDSALGQTRPPHQIVIIDDGSTDGTSDFLAERYGGDSRVEVVAQPNQGHLGAMAAGMRRTTGDIVCLLDADDYWDPDYLETIGRLYDARPDIDLVFTDLHRFGADGGSEIYGVETFAEAEEDYGYTAIVTYFTDHKYGTAASALSMRRSWALRSTDFPPHFLRMWRTCADACLLHAASIYGARKYFLPTGRVHYRVHGNNLWYNKWNRVTDYKNPLHKRMVRNYCASVIGMEANCAYLAPLEFATKPAPSAAERARYATLLPPPAEPAPEPVREEPAAAEPAPPAPQPAGAGSFTVRLRRPWRHPRRYLRDVARVVLQKPNL
ncbi:glycosyltransferase family 2 protein [Ancylobacter lacus]|uniref:glycosyltransferase family 2 protein n=1 Tax=Ancylobacter lacus TaxID=2579970 RepID=UPI001BCF4A82|nr:glycosyltransferase family 2 protein [Ancylobacter lacus]MBS7539918.1 glycosyltransferase family 2 protein [Ancylobacter lacus]